MSLRRILISSVCAMVAATSLNLSFVPNANAAQPVEVYAELPRTSQVRVSPNGQFVAMVSPYKNAKGVFIYNLKDPSAKVKVMPSPDGAMLDSIRWGSNKHILMVAQYRRSGGRRKMRKFGTQFNEYVSTNIETGESIKLGQMNFLHILPNEQNHVLFGYGDYAGEFIYRNVKVNLDTGKETTVRRLDRGRIILDTVGENVLAREEYNSRSGQYKLYDKTASGEKNIYQTRLDSDKNRALFMLTKLPNSGKFLMYEGERETPRFFTIDPETGAQAPYRFDFNLPSSSNYFPVFDPYTNELIGVSYSDDYNHTLYFAEPYKSWMVKAKKAFAGKRVSILSRTEDNSAVTLFVQGNKDGGEYFLFEPQIGQASSLGKRYPELKPSDIGQTVRVDYTARDGHKIPAYLTLPPGKTTSSGPMPLIAMPHGGPIARDNANFDWWAQYLATQGYAIFKPQFRGSTGFGHAHKVKGYGEFGVGMVTDTVDGVKHLISKGIANPDKMCVTGASYGGYQAFALPVVEPDMFKCSLSLNGVSDIPAILKYEVARGGRNGAPIKQWNQVIGDYYDDRDAMKEQSPARNIDVIKTEIVIMHGEDDMTVPFEQSKIMAKALKAAGRNSEVIVLKEDDHYLSHARSRLKLLQESEKLFSKHLD